MLALSGDAFTTKKQLARTPDRPPQHGSMVTSTRHSPLHPAVESDSSLFSGYSGTNSPVLKERVELGQVSDSPFTLDFPKSTHQPPAASLTSQPRARSPHQSHSPVKEASPPRELPPSSPWLHSQELVEDSLADVSLPMASPDWGQTPTRPALVQRHLPGDTGVDSPSLKDMFGKCLRASVSYFCNSIVQGIL